jgi:hypothetical protein
MHTIWRVPQPGSNGRTPGVLSACSPCAGFSGSRSFARPLHPTVALLVMIAGLLPLLTGCGSISGIQTGTLVASSSALAFGNVPVGQSASATVSLTNSSSTAVQISQLNVSGQYFSLPNPGNLPVTVPGGGTYSVNVQFRPTASGQAAGTLMLTSNASSGATANINLNGTGTASTPGNTPAAMISPSPGSVLPGSTTGFAWTLGSGVTEYQLWLGTTGAGSSNLGVYTATPDSTGNISVNVTGLPTNGSSVYARLLSQIQGNWQANDYTYTASGSTASAPQPSEAEVTGLSCNDTNITGTDADNCTVTMSSVTSSDLNVTLASDNSAVTLPASVAVPAGASTISFTATAAAVNSAETATITASTATSAQSFALQLSPETSGSTGSAALSVSANRLAFGDVTVNTATSQSVTLTSTGTAPLTINSATVAGAGFSASGGNFPATLLPGQALTVQVQFDPLTTGAVSGSVSISSNSSIGGVTVISLGGTGDAAAGNLQSLGCASNALSGAATDDCTVNLNAAAPNGGITVSLTSSSSSVTVPAAITVPAGASSASFVATALSVPSTQTVDLAATTPDGRAKSFTLQLEGQTATLALSANTLAFGNVNLNTTTTEAVTLTSTGAAPLTISGATLVGAGFTVGGANFPATLNPGQSLMLQVKFDPTTSGSVSGSLTIASNSSSGATTVIALAATGQSPAVALSAFSCAQASMTGAGTDACTVTLTGAAPSGGLAVNVSSNDGAVTVPGVVEVPAGSASAGFNAAVSAVTSNQTAVMTATVGGMIKAFAVQLNGGTAALSLSAASLSFGNVTLNNPTTQSVTLSSTGTAPLVINGVTVTGSGFTAGGASFPVTLNPRESVTLQVQFDPTTAGAVNGSLAIASNSSSGGTTLVSLTGNGQPPAGALSSISCTNGSITGAGSDSCTVTLTGAAPAGGLAVTLSSNNSSVLVPRSITIPGGSASAGFSATVSAVTSSQTATLTAASGGTTKTFALQLGPGTPGLTVNATTVPFGNVNVNSPATQTVILTSSGTAPVTVNSAVVTGAGFTLSGGTVPVTLAPGQTAMLSLQFNPATTGAANGMLTINSNASTGGTVAVTLTGTGQSSTTYEVDLSWDAPASSSDPVSGYNIYRQTGSGSYQLLNASANTPNAYADSTVQSGTTYSYEVKSVDAEGNESSASNVFTVTIP